MRSKRAPGEPVRIGLLDSGVAGEATARRRFVLGSAGVEGFEQTRPFADHGSAIAALIRAAGPEQVDLIDAQIFEGRLHCPPSVAAAGLLWLLEQGALLINLSWGLEGEDGELLDACERALAQGVWLVAATPIRGAAPAPARYPGVVTATGDARCTLGEISSFGGDPADFGASPRPPHETDEGQSPLRGGSSFACARVCGALARALETEPRRDPRARLRENAAHSGPQTPPSGR